MNLDPGHPRSMSGRVHQPPDYTSAAMCSGKDFVFPHDARATGQPCAVPPRNRDVDSDHKVVLALPLLLGDQATPCDSDSNFWDLRS
eukprot:CAMPEP_0115244068 /NCGR_PEP_ID=MMETSP0270-20121206/39797_1 /TAXON_ID=71861 /ORGANISM="Scrippsiella trochoidea, Strain CCMP3099" /LENGTH=86 /DNA_ID=CAMNT_0002659193 /DNA_START=709 /DNA_END=969 /DNA_ORIENTATION=-